MDIVAVIKKRKRAAARGFSLVEMAIAMFIFGLVISSILVPAADLYQDRKNKAADAYLNRVSQAVMTYALHNRTAFRRIMYDGAPSYVPAGRPYLPCPDTDGDGIEDRNAIAAAPVINQDRNDDGKCVSQKGTIPWQTLQLQPIIDPWGNYLTYHVDYAYSDALLGFDETTRADRHDLSRAPMEMGNVGFLNVRTTVTTPAADNERGRQPFYVCDRPTTNSGVDGGFCDFPVAGVIGPPNVAPTEFPYFYEFAVNFPDRIIKGVVFALVSHGQNGRYARRSGDNGCNSGGPVALTVYNDIAFGGTEYRNGYNACDPVVNIHAPQSFYYSYPLTEDPQRGEFDDVLRWTMAEELIAALNASGEMLENGAESESPLPITKLPFLP